MATPSPSEQPAVSQRVLDFGAGRSTAYLMGAQFLRNLSPLLVLFFLAQLTNPETVGTYSLALAIVTPFFVFAQLGLRTVTITLRPEAAFRNYALVQTGGVVLALIATMVFCMMGTPELALVVVPAALIKVADAFTEFLSGPLQRHGRSVTIFTASLIAAIAVSIVAAVVLYLTRELVPTLFSLAAASLFAAYFFLFRPAHKVAHAVESAQPAPRATVTTEIRRIATAGLPLGVATSVMSLVSTVPQYVVTANDGTAETARLAVLLYIYALADIVTGVICQAWIPHAQEHMHRSAARHPVLALSVRGSVTWSLVYVPVTVIGLFLSAWLVPVVFGSSYTLTLAEAIPLGLAILSLPSAHFMAAAVAIQNDYVHSLTVAIGSTLLSLATCVLLVPRIGIAGAFWAVVVAVVARASIAAAILVLRGRKHARRPA